jgi:ElaB/YqjD/DUF883 family membrane-anchored ribosome-binding protein
LTYRFVTALSTELHFLLRIQCVKTHPLALGAAPHRPLRLPPAGLPVPEADTLRKHAMSNQNPLGDNPNARAGATAGGLGTGTGSTTDTLTARAHEGLDTLAERANSAERRVRDKATRVSEQVGQAAGRARQKSAQVRQTVSEYTGENPMMSLAIAFFAGVLLAAIARR